MMMECSKSLAPHTGKVFEIISQLECIKPYTLVGGTALSLQIEKRQSEDMDFMKWLTKRNEKPEVDWDCWQCLRMAVVLSKRRVSRNLTPSIMLLLTIFRSISSRNCLRISKLTKK